MTDYLTTLYRDSLTVLPFLAAGAVLALMWLADWVETRAMRRKYGERGFPVVTEKERKGR